MVTKAPCGLRLVSRYASYSFRPRYFPRIYHHRHHHRHHGPSSRLRFSPSFRHYSSTVTATRVVHNTRINPPASTLPPPLLVPSRTPSQSTPSYYYALGKAYLSFYKTGLKSVYTNYYASKAIRQSLPKGVSIQQAASQGQLSRADFQLLRRSSHDIMRIPAFVLVFMVCGEFTPLVVLALSGIVPRTCRIPRQVVAAREKMERRRSESFRSGVVAGKRAIAKGNEDGFEGVYALRREEILHVGRSLGLYSIWWDKIGVPSVALVRERVRKRVEYLDHDDILIKRDGDVGVMETEELKISLEERGLDVLGKGDGALKMLLKSWLKAKEAQPISKLLLTRPSAWATEQ